MSSRKCTTIPHGFSWVLPAQSLVTGVAIYSTVSVFTVGSKPFILAVAAAGLHFILGLYCCFTANRPGIHHRFVVPILLAAIAGVWCAPVYYFARVVDVYLKLQQISSPKGQTLPSATWNYVGLATCCLDVILALALLTIFLVEGLRSPSCSPGHSVPGSYPYNTTQSQPTPYQYQHPQHQQQYYQHPPVMTAPQTYSPPYTTPTPTPDTKYHPQTSTTPISPIISPTSAPTSAPPSYNSTNRIDVIRRLCALQHPDGHWSPSPEIASLLQQWGGSSNAYQLTDSRAVTAAVTACLGDMCAYVWAAQRDRAESARLAPGEMESFRLVGWDLGFARGAVERGRGWVG